LRPWMTSLSSEQVPDDWPASRIARPPCHHERHRDSLEPGIDDLSVANKTIVVQRTKRKLRRGPCSRSRHNRFFETKLTSA
jgi:hypothetical protein